MGVPHPPKTCARKKRGRRSVPCIKAVEILCPLPLKTLHAWVSSGSSGPVWARAGPGQQPNNGWAGACSHKGRPLSGSKQHHGRDDWLGLPTSKATGTGQPLQGSGRQLQTVKPAAYGHHIGRGWLQGIDIRTATTADTATTACIKDLRVLSLSSVTPWTEDKSFRVSSQCSPALPWCLVPVVASICSAEKAPAPHRLPAAPARAHAGTQTGSKRLQQGHHGDVCGAGAWAVTFSPATI